MTVEQLMFCLLRNEMKGDPLPEGKLPYRDSELYRLSRRQDVCHLVADALIRNDLLSEKDAVSKAYSRMQLTAVYREVQIRDTTERIYAILQDGKVPFIPLKGTVIRKFYPEPWMRTSCDIDILVHESDLKRAIDLLKEGGFETDGVLHFHDVSLFFNNVHLELHYNILEDMKQVDQILQAAWDHATQKDGVEYELMPAFFMFYHLAHMFYHFSHGGCGVRFLLDFWILKRANFFEEKDLLPLLEECRLIPFYKYVCKLTEYWFEGVGELDQYSALVGEHILEGGIYGDRESGNAASIARKKGRFFYLFSLAFPSFLDMSVQYPVLKRCPVLLPFCYIIRAFRKMIGKDRKDSWGKFNRTVKQKSSRINAMEVLMNELGIE